MGTKAQIVLIWLALLLLLAATVGGSLVFSGAVGLLVSLGIAFTKSGMIYWKYMHVGEQPGLLRVTAFAAGAWLIILFLFTAADYLTRGLN
jgi:cytochrome c oxidase subunit 4